MYDEPLNGKTTNIAPLGHSFIFRVALPLASVRAAVLTVA
jgi:hypothetical protein